jgi:hypothetical protein
LLGATLSLNQSRRFQLTGFICQPRRVAAWQGLASFANFDPGPGKRADPAPLIFCPDEFNDYLGELLRNINNIQRVPGYPLVPPITMIHLLGLAPAWCLAAPDNCQGGRVHGEVQIRPKVTVATLCH